MDVTGESIAAYTLPFQKRSMGNTARATENVNDKICQRACSLDEDRLFKLIEYANK